MIVPPGSGSVSVDVFFADDTGAAVTGKVAADFPACKWSSGTNTADTTITLSDLAAITTAHPNDNTAGGVKEREGGWYRLDLPNNMFTSAGRKTLTFAETTNKRIIAPPLDCQYVQGDARQWLGGAIPAVTQTGVPKVDVAYLLGTGWLTPGTAGTPDVNVKLWNALTTVALPLVPTVAGRTLDVSAGGEAGLDWANVGSPTTAVNLSATTINLVNTATTVTNQLTAAAIATGIWQDTTAGDFTVASSIGKSLYTSGNAPGAASGIALVGSNMGSVTSVTGAVGSVTAGVTVTTNNDKTGYSLTVTPPTAATIATTVWQDLLAGADFGTASSIGALLKADIDATISSRLASASYTAPTNLTAAQIATGVWTDTTAGDFTTALSIGKSIMNGVSLGTGLTIAAVSGAVGSVTGAVGSVTGNVGGNVVGSVGSVTGAVGSVTAGVTVTTNNDKTGYSLTQTFPANFSALSISASTGLVDITQTAADKVWGTATRVLTAGTNIVLAKGTGVTGFNDLAASAVENAVWDAVLASHATAGSTGAALASAGGSGDPWSTALPGVYANGTAGYIVGNLLLTLWTATAKVNRDDANGFDRWTVKISKNGVLQTSLTTVALRVVKRDNTNLIASANMTDEGGGSFILDTNTQRLTPGLDVEPVVTATDGDGAHDCYIIGGITGRDSTA